MHHCSEGNNGGRSQWKRALMRNNKSCLPGLIQNGSSLKGTSTASNYGTASEFAFPFPLPFAFPFPFPSFLVLPLPFLQLTKWCTRQTKQCTPPIKNTVSKAGTRTKTYLASFPGTKRRRRKGLVSAVRACANRGGMPGTASAYY